MPELSRFYGIRVFVCFGDHPHPTFMWSTRNTTPNSTFALWPCFKVLCLQEPEAWLWNGLRAMPKNS